MRAARAKLGVFVLLPNDMSRKRCRAGQGYDLLSRSRRLLFREGSRTRLLLSRIRGQAVSIRRKLHVRLSLQGSWRPANFGPDCRPEPWNGHRATDPAIVAGYRKFLCGSRPHIGEPPRDRHIPWLFRNRTLHSAVQVHSLILSLGGNVADWQQPIPA